MIVIDFLKWILIPSGIVCVEERGKLGWFAAIKNLLSGGVPRRPDGPTAQEHVGWARLRKRLRRVKCPVCNVHFWTWREKRQVCYRFSCYKRRTR